MSKDLRFKYTEAEIMAHPDGHLYKLANSGEIWEMRVSEYGYRNLKQPGAGDYGGAFKSESGLSRLWLLPVTDEDRAAAQAARDRTAEREHQQVRAGLAAKACTALTDDQLKHYAAHPEELAAQLSTPAPAIGRDEEESE